MYKGEEFNPKCTKKTVKFGGGSVMVFGMFSIHGIYPLVCLNTRVNAAIYKKLLDDHVIPNINNSGINDGILCKIPRRATKLRNNGLANSKSLS